MDQSSFVAHHKTGSRGSVLTSSNSKLVKIDRIMKRLRAELEHCKNLMNENSKSREIVVEQMSYLIKDRGEILSFYEVAEDARLTLDNLEERRNIFLMELNNSDVEDERAEHLLRILRLMTIGRQYLTVIERSIKTLSEHMKEAETELEVAKMRREAIHSCLHQKLAEIGRDLHDAKIKRIALESRNNRTQLKHHET